MDRERPPYTVTITATDADDEIIARCEMMNGNPDTAMAAYGHAVEGMHCFYRDRRWKKDLLASAKNEAEEIKKNRRRKSASDDPPTKPIDEKDEPTPGAAQ